MVHARKLGRPGLPNVELNFFLINQNTRLFTKYTLKTKLLCCDSATTNLQSEQTVYDGFVRTDFFSFKEA